MTIEERLEELRLEAERKNISTAALMITVPDGYYTADGVFHDAKGITASPNVYSSNIAASSEEEGE